MKIFTISVVILLVLDIGCFTANAYSCFKCNSNENQLCSENPEELPFPRTVECDAYCTTVRTEYTDIPGESITLVRDCEKEPIVVNGVRTDKHYTKMYTSCNTDQCNSGDGKREPGEGEGGRSGPKDVITVNEQSGSDWINKPSHLLTLAVIILYTLY